VIQARPKTANSQNARCRDGTERFVEIRAVLLRDPVEALWGQDVPRSFGQAIHVANHCIGNKARLYRGDGPAIGSNESRCKL